MSSSRESKGANSTNRADVFRDLRRHNERRARLAEAQRERQLELGRVVQDPRRRRFRRAG